MRRPMELKQVAIGLLWLVGILGLLALVLVGILGLPWQWQLARDIAFIHARGEPVICRDLLPLPLPSANNGALPLMALWADLESEKAFWDTPNLGDGSPVDQKQVIWNLSHNYPEGASQKMPFDWTTDAFLDLIKRRPDLLDRLESALRLPQYQFPVDPSKPTTENGFETSRHKAWRSAGALMDLCNYYRITGERQKVQRCRLLLLRCPQMMDGAFWPTAVHMRTGLTERTCGQLRNCCQDLSDSELAELQKAAGDLKPCPIPWQQVIRQERVEAIETLHLDGYDLRSQMPDAMGHVGRVMNSPDRLLFAYTYRRYVDSVDYLQQFQDAIDSKLARSSTFLNQFFISPFQIRRSLEQEAAIIRQLQLGLELERIKRQRGTYPAALDGIPLSSVDADGKTMSYQVFGEGQGMRLELKFKKWLETPVFELGAVPAKPATPKRFTIPKPSSR